MKRVATGLLGLIVTLWTTIYWVEAEKEVVVLCGLSEVGSRATEVQRLLGTASLVRLRVDTVESRITSRIVSARNLSLTSCTVIVDDSVTVASTYRERLRVAPLLGLRRSLHVEDRVPPAVLSPLVPHSAIAGVLTGMVTLLCLGALVAVLQTTTQRWRWPKAALLIVAINLGGILLVGG